MVNERKPKVWACIYCHQDGCAVFYNSQDLRDMAGVLMEAADIFDDEVKD
jgi:hypothetical protein